MSAIDLRSSVGFKSVNTASCGLGRLAWHAGHVRFPLACTLGPDDSEHGMQKIWLQK